MNHCYLFKVDYISYYSSSFLINKMNHEVCRIVNSTHGKPKVVVREYLLVKDKTLAISAQNLHKTCKSHFISF